MRLCGWRVIINYMRAAVLTMWLVLAIGTAHAGRKKKVSIESNPKGASVFVDDLDRERCKAPCDVEVDDDSTITVTLKGYRPKSEAVKFKRTEKAPYKRTFTLKKALGSLIVDGPKDADVFVDDENRGKAPVEIAASEGEHTVVIKLGGKQIYSQDVTVAANDEVHIKGEEPKVATKEPPPKEPKDPPDPAGDGTKSNDGDGTKRIDIDGGSIEKPKPAPRSSEPFFAANAIVSVAVRDFKYKAPDAGNSSINPANETGQVLPGVTIELWPGRLAGVTVLSGLSIYGRAQFGAVKQEVTLDDQAKTKFGATTKWSAYEALIRQRFLLGPVALEVGGGYSREQMLYAGMAADQLPGGDYAAIKIAVQIAKRAGGVLPYLSYNQLIVRPPPDSGLLVNFPMNTPDVSGIRVAAGIAINSGRFVGRVEAAGTQYTWTFNPQQPAQGATDRIGCFSAFAGFAY